MSIVIIIIKMKIKKELLTPLSIIISALIIATSLYLGVTLEFRSKLKACEIRHKNEPKKIERCKITVSFGHSYGKKRNKKRLKDKKNSNNS
tara:strand:+ start:37 stop:309 length:273 start_codon:yes stop_codon:yes gene_type:complete